MNDIKIIVVDKNNREKEFIAPTDMGLSLMEFLKGNEYDILATCGGMALCATCHVEILSKTEDLPDIIEEEYAMLDTLPNITDTSRLSCQLKLNPALNGIKVRIMGDGLS